MDSDLQRIAELLDSHLDSTRVWPNGRVIQIRRLIATVKDLKIEIHPKDHRPPHFHVTSKQRNINARFSTLTLALLDSDQNYITHDDVKKIQNFFEDHPDSLVLLQNEHRRLVCSEEEA